MGILLGNSGCFAFCLPIIAPLIAGTQKGWLNGLKSVLIFSLARVLAYIVLAIISVRIGQIVVRNYYESGWGQYIYLIVGIVIVVFGVFIALSRDSNFTHRFCIHKNIFQNKLHSIAIIGLLIGFSPCIPLFGVLSYIALESKTIPNGIFYAMCFGAGTIISPLIPIGVLASGLPDLIKWNKVIEIIRRVCGIYLVYVGIKLALS